MDSSFDAKDGASELFVLLKQAVAPICDELKPFILLVLLQHFDHILEMRDVFLRSLTDHSLRLAVRCSLFLEESIGWHVTLRLSTDAGSCRLRHSQGLGQRNSFVRVSRVQDLKYRNLLVKMGISRT